MPEAISIPLPIPEQAIRKFWRRVIKADDDACWIFRTKGCKNRYGRFTINYQSFLATRIMWVLIHGSIDDTLDVLHKCDNPPCVNPAHLFLGTDTDNARDAAAKGRHWLQRNPERTQGSNHPRSKLTEEQVIAIRQAHAAGVSAVDLAAHYSRPKQTIESIIYRYSWKHLR